MRELLSLCHRIACPPDNGDPDEGDPDEGDPDGGDPDEGDKVRAFHHLEQLSRSFCNHLGCLADYPADPRHVPVLRWLTASLGCFAFDPRAAPPRRLAGLAPGRPPSLDYFCNRQPGSWVTPTQASRPIAQVFVF